MNTDKLKFDSNGLLPAIIQDHKSLDVLMLGYMNNESLKLTKETGFVTFYSRSQKKLWMKGETSGNKLILKKMFIDCDNDTILIFADPLGPTCHKGPVTCFNDKNITNNNFLLKLEKIIDKKALNEESGSYTNQLFQKGLKEIAKKVTEEAGEVSISAVAKDGRIIDESADLLFHLLVLLRNQSLSIIDVISELEKRSISQ
ncbi:MAG: bifunctional phosphoribosyl-AMP cyclohydrolase/phosphoribosyl-ATP diphosphatase [Gammaproteobacteria bacterium]|nr:bifunctional phosphoribosyl-AMP cyclohydrolase/phosphoribosyl-ATP diphosphatase [Gammaproteobacteria bacterium]